MRPLLARFLVLIWLVHLLHGASFSLLDELFNNLRRSVTYAEYDPALQVIAKLEKIPYHLQTNDDFQAQLNSLITKEMFHVIGTMHRINEMALTIQPEVQRLKQMHSSLLKIFKKMTKYIEYGPIIMNYDDKASLYCEILSNLVIYRLNKPFKYLLLQSSPKILTNSMLYDCFENWNENTFMNQTLFHNVLNVHTSGFVRVLLHFPKNYAKYVLKYLNINYKNFTNTILIGNRSYNIVFLKDIAQRIKPYQIMTLIETAAFRLNMPLNWYYNKDIFGNTGFDLVNDNKLIMRQTGNVFYKVLSQIYYKFYNQSDKNENHGIDFCVSPQELTNYLIDCNINFGDSVMLLSDWNQLATKTLKTNYISDTNGLAQLRVFVNDTMDKTSLEKPYIFVGGVGNQWNINISGNDHIISQIYDDSTKNHIFHVSNIPYQELYDDSFEQSVEMSFQNYMENIFNISNSVTRMIENGSYNQVNDIIETNIDLNLDLPRIHHLVSNICEMNNDWINNPYIFDSKILSSDNDPLSIKLNTLFDIWQLIPNFLQNIIKNRGKAFGLSKKESFGYITTLKQFALGGVGTGAQPHWHGSAWNGLIMGQKLWILIPPQFAFQMKCTALEFFCRFGMLDTLLGQTNTQFVALVQNPGDTVFVPQDWGHVVLNLKSSMAIAVELSS